LSTQVTAESKPLLPPTNT